MAPADIRNDRQRHPRASGGPSVDGVHEIEVALLTWRSTVGMPLGGQVGIVQSGTSELKMASA